ncbi:hypothetical protein M569_13532, partial [Genlisea aurea]
SFFKFVDDFISDHLDPPEKLGFGSLSGNFAPVSELLPTPCPEVEGEIPASLRGVYVRNGSNPQFVPRGSYHPFDGDGMVHAVKIDGGGEARFCSRFVKTYKYVTEGERGYPFFFSIFTSFTAAAPSIARLFVIFARFVTGECDLRRGIGVANTSLFHLAGKLFALCESDLPYELKLTSDGDVITLGRHDSFGGIGPFVSMTGHPKIDPDSGEAFAFRVSLKPPFLAYFAINREGIKQPEVPISSVNEVSLIHDFAISRNYAIFPENQIVIRPANVLRSRPLVTVDPTKSTRLGIVPRHADHDGDFFWVDCDVQNLLHVVNAWEEDGGDAVVLVATSVLGVENFLYKMDSFGGSVNLIEINLKERTSRCRSLSAANLDFAGINPAYVGKRNRYIYAGIGAPMPRTSGVVKLDVNSSSVDCTVARHMFPAGCYGGEPLFVSKNPMGTAESDEDDEDDGYIVSYVHDENAGESRFIIMDAKSPTLHIVASVKLPQRVPYGYHGIFVRPS